MAYSKQTWANGAAGGTPVNAIRLGFIEQGIKDAHDLIAAFVAGTAQIADDAVTAAKIAADAVGSSEIAPNAVGTSELANAAVTVPKINASGTPDASTFLRGDGTWGNPASAGLPRTDTTITAPSPASVTAGTPTVIGGLTSVLTGAGHTLASDSVTVPAGTYAIQGCVDFSVAYNGTMRGCFLQVVTVSSGATALYGHMEPPQITRKVYGAHVELTFTESTRIQLVGFSASSTSNRHVLASGAGAQHRLSVRRVA